MKLTFNEIYYHLKKLFSIRRISCNPKKILVEKPLYYRDGENLSGHIVLVENEKFKKITLKSPALKDCVFICFGEVDTIFCRMDRDLIILDKEVEREEVFNRLQEIFYYFEKFEKSVVDVFMENLDFTHLMGCCEKIFETPVALTDEKFAYVAAVDRDGYFIPFKNSQNALDLKFVSEFICDFSYENTIKLKGVYSYSLEQGTYLCKNIFFEVTYVGKLTALSSSSPLKNDYHKDLLELLADYVEKMYVRYGSFNQSDVSMDELHRVMKQCLDGKSCPEKKWDLAFENVGWEKGEHFCLIELRSKCRRDRELFERYLCPEMERRWKDTCCVIADRGLYVLLNTSRSPMVDFQPDLAYFLRENLLTAASSREFTKTERFMSAVRQTEIGFELGMKKNPEQWHYRFGEYALMYLMMHGAEEFLPEEVDSLALQKLMEHDRQTGTQYYKTLECYVKCRYNAAHTAKELFIHRSTFLNRLERIKELTKLDLDDFASRLYVELSIYRREEKKYLES